MISVLARRWVEGEGWAGQIQRAGVVEVAD